MALRGHLSAGNVLGRYELLLPIAAGGMATVWAARLKGSHKFKKIVAIKTMLPELLEEQESQQMFLDEAAVASRINHPHVVEIFDLGEEHTVPYIVMEWIDGEPLSLILKVSSKQGGVPLPIAVRIMMQTCAGMHAAHELRDEAGQLVGLVHRDMSPQNVLVTYAGVVKIVDFGIAKATGRTVKTIGGQVKGKIRHMAPEQAKGLAIDRRTDIFALGILLYQLTTGVHPFHAETDAASLAQILSPDPPTPPSQRLSTIPAALESVIMQALAKDPAMRFPTANEMLRALDQSLPKNMHASTDEEVANFLNTLLADYREKREVALQEAQWLADERLAGRTSHSEVILERPLFEGSGSSITMVPVQSSRPSLAGAPQTSTDLSAASAPSDAPPPLPPPPARGRLLPAAAFVSLLLGGWGAGAYYFQSQSTLAASATSATTPSASAPPTAPPASSAATEPPAPPASSTPPAASAAPSASSSKRSPRAPTAPEGLKTKVRTPGF